MESRFSELLISETGGLQGSTKIRAVHPKVQLESLGVDQVLDFSGHRERKVLGTPELENSLLQAESTFLVATDSALELDGSGHLGPDSCPGTRKSLDQGRRFGAREGDLKVQIVHVGESARHALNPQDRRALGNV
jgi:hypothetical protein